MSTITKDLGVVTAYGYAVTQGYTGTEEEFAELMASYATVAEQAAQSAETAEEAAQAAAQAVLDANAAKTAAQAAQSAAESASTTAQGAATSASNSATSAASSASTASTAATTATEKAQEAATSATSASESATDANAAKTAAQTAKTDAETAQGKAEEAQAKAEEAAEDLSAEVAQIETNKNDIADLKSDLSDVNERLYTEVTRSNLLETIITTWLQKYIRDNGSLGNSDISCTTDYIIPSQGRIALTVGDGYKAKVFEYLPNGGAVGLVKNDITGQNIFAVAIGNKLRVQVTRLDASNIAPADITSSVIIIENVYNELLQLDKTFTESGKAADAKSVGNVLNMTGVPFVDGYYIATSRSTVDISSLVESPYYSCCVADCSAGDYFLISAKGGGTPRAWCFIDGSGNSLAVSASNAEVTHETLIAPPNAVKLIVNNSDIISFPNYYCYKGKTAEAMETEVNNKINFTNARLGLSEKSFSPGYITTKNVNQTIDPTPNESSVFMYAIVPCTKGQPFVITGTPNDNSGQRLYAFTNANYVVIYRHNDPSAVTNYQIYAPADGYLIVNVLKAYSYYLYSGLADYLMLKTRQDNILLAPFTTLPNLLSVAAYRQLGTLSKGYIVMMTDDGDNGLATDTIPLAIQKNVPFTFALMQKSNVFKNETYTQTLLDAIENHGCSVAQHGDNLWSRMTEQELNAYFDTEKVFFDNLGIELKGAVVPAHDTNELVKAVCGGRFGVVRSGYSGRIYETGEDQHSITNYYDYYTSGERSNIFGLSSFNNSTATAAYNTAAIDYAYANHKVLICYFHENAMTAERWTLVGNMIDYAKSIGLTFTTLGEIPYLL